MADITFTIIKPELVRRGLGGMLLHEIISNGFQIIAMKLTRFSVEQAKAFYSIHEGKVFFETLIRYITSGPVIVAILQKENAVEEFRALIGNTNPDEAAEGTLRKKYGSSTEQNAIHGSDSDNNALLEASCFFSLFERYTK
jgi:nucleoside-diphosphate kinase